MRGEIAGKWIGRLALVAATSVPALGQMPGMSGKPGTSDAAAHADMRWSNTLFVLFDQLEYAAAGVGKPINVDVRGWYGGAHRRLWFRAQSDFATELNEGEAEAQLMYGRLVSPFWDAVAGVRVDQHWGDRHRQRPQLVVGLVGLAPYRFEVEPSLFVSGRGDVSARFEASYQLLITQRLIAEPEMEVNAALQAVPEFDVVSGINDYEVGLRLRYEFRRELAPYVGWSRSRRTTGSPGSIPGRGAVAESRFVAGLRLWW